VRGEELSRRCLAPPLLEENPRGVADPERLLLVVLLGVQGTLGEKSNIPGGVLLAVPIEMDIGVLVLPLELRRCVEETRAAALLPGVVQTLVWL
jgi:hypothetical protein